MYAAPVPCGLAGHTELVCWRQGMTTTGITRHGAPATPPIRILSSSASKENEEMTHELRLLLVRRMGRQYAAIVAGGVDCVASMMREWVLVRR